MKRLLLLLVATFPPAARGELIVQTAATPRTTFQGAFAPLVFQKYHGPGELISVTLTEHASIEHTFAIQAFNATTLRLDVTAAILGFGPVSESRSVTTAGPGVFTPDPTVSRFTRTLTLSAAEFVGPGVFTVPVASLATSLFTSSSGNGFGSVTTVGMADATLTYNVRPPAGPLPVPLPLTAPEPSTLAGAGLAGLTGLGRAWKRRRAT